MTPPPPAPAPPPAPRGTAARARVRPARARPDDIAGYAGAPTLGVPVLSPDGAVFAQLVTRDGRSRLHLHRPGRGRHGRQLPEPVLPVEPCWLPDGRLATLVAGPDGAERAEVPTVLLTDPDGRTSRRLPLSPVAARPRRLWASDDQLYVLAAPDGGGRLFSVHPEHGTCRALTGPDVAVEDADVAPDGTVVVIARGAGGGPADTPGTGPAPTGHLAGGEPVLARLLPPGNAAPGTGPDTFVPLTGPVRTPGTREQLLALSADGDRVVYGHDDGAGRYTVRYRPVSGPAGPGEPLACGPGTVMRARWRGDRVLVQVFHGLRCRLRETVPGGAGSYRTVASPDGAYPGFTVATRTGRVAFLAQRWDTPPEVRVTPASGGDRPLAGVTAAHRRSPPGGPTARVVAWHSTDGTRVEGLLVRPAGAPAGTPLPLVTLLHGGPHHHWHAGWHGSWSDWSRLLANRGYAVLCPNVRGSTGRGTAFAHTIRGDLATRPLADLLSGVDALVADGTADQERLGVGGWSYGAYLGAWAITRTDRFRTAVLGAGMYDLYDLVTTSRLGPAWRGFCATPQGPGDRAPFDALSPLRYAAGCRTPTLLIHGTADGKVPVRQSRRMRNALLSAGAPVGLVELPDAGHAPERTRDRAVLLERMADWYLRHL